MRIRIAFMIIIVLMLSGCVESRYESNDVITPIDSSYDDYEAFFSEIFEYAGQYDDHMYIEDVLLRINADSTFTLSITLVKEQNFGYHSNLNIIYESVSKCIVSSRYSYENVYHSAPNGEKIDISQWEFSFSEAIEAIRTLHGQEFEGDVCYCKENQWYIITSNNEKVCVWDK